MTSYALMSDGERNILKTQNVLNGIDFCEVVV